MEKPIHNRQDRPEFSKMDTRERILWRADQYGIPSAMTREEAFVKLLKRIENGEKSKEVPVVRFNRVFFRLAVAASALLAALILFFSTYNPKETVIAGRGNHSEYLLPDGTTVSLNSDSRISFGKRNFTGKRDVTFEGEGFFSVAKGSRFSIKTSNAEITILGTSFNVYSRDKLFRVSCFTGRILVTAGSQSVVINPGETASIEGNRLTARTDPKIETAAGWRNGELYFENTELNQVLEELERQFNVTFDTPNLDDKFFTGTIIGKNLENALDILCIPMGLNYEIGENSKIIIRSKAE